MIYGKLMGGLGNQLFIYAFCRNLVEISGKKAVLLFPESYREIEINKFKLDSRIEILSNPLEQIVDVDLMKKYQKQVALVEKLSTFGNFFRTEAIRFGVRQGIYYNIDGYLAFDFEKFAGAENCIFCGYMQCKQYVEPIRNILLNEISLNSNYSSNISIDNESVCVHIRRGDYLNEEFNDRFLVCTPTYYEKAFQRMHSLYPNAKFYVFSDDLQWVENNMMFINEYKHEYMYSSNEQSTISDFEMMKMCKHFIISNSSYSWWAQFLGRDENKHVIAPNRWYNYGYDGHDLYQSNWDIVEA